MISTTSPEITSRRHRYQAILGVARVAAHVRAERRMRRPRHELPAACGRLVAQRRELIGERSRGWLAGFVAGAGAGPGRGLDRGADALARGLERARRPAAGSAFLARVRRGLGAGGASAGFARGGRGFGAASGASAGLARERGARLGFGAGSAVPPQASRSQRASWRASGWWRRACAGRAWASPRRLVGLRGLLSRGLHHLHDLGGRRLAGARRRGFAGAAAASAAVSARLGLLRPRACRPPGLRRGVLGHGLGPGLRLGRLRGRAAPRAPRLRRLLPAASAASSTVSTDSSVTAPVATASTCEVSPAPFLRRRRDGRLPLPFGKLRSSSRASAAGLRDMRVRAPLMTSPASAVCGIAAASSAADSRRSCWRAACTSRRALRACAPPDEFTSSPSSRLVSGQRWTAYSSWTSRVMFAQRQIQLLAWSRRPIFFSASACSTTLTPSRLSSRGQPSTKSSARSNASASRADGDLLQRAQAQLRVLVAVDGGDQERALELAALVEVQHRPRAAPAGRRHARAGQRGPLDLLAVVEVLDGDPPQLALEDLDPPVLVGRDRQHAALDAQPAPAAAAHRADDDRAAAVDVAVQQRVQRHDRVVVLGRRMHEVDDDARLLARLAARDAADALLVDALGGGRREVHADRRARRVPALGEQLRVDQHVDVAALVAREDLRQLALGRLARDGLRLHARGRGTPAATL